MGGFAFFGAARLPNLGACIMCVLHSFSQDPRIADCNREQGFAQGVMY